MIFMGSSFIPSSQSLQYSFSLSSSNSAIFSFIHLFILVFQARGIVSRISISYSQRVFCVEDLLKVTPLCLPVCSPEGVDEAYTTVYEELRPTFAHEAVAKLVEMGKTLGNCWQKPHSSPHAIQLTCHTSAPRQIPVSGKGFAMSLARMQMACIIWAASHIPISLMSMVQPSQSTAQAVGSAMCSSADFSPLSLWFHICCDLIFRVHTCCQSIGEWCSVHQGDKPMLRRIELKMLDFVSARIDIPSLKLT